LSITSLIDIHSHLLPGIDDGCRTLDESLACVRALIDHGFVGTVCTPHMAIRDFPGNTPASIGERVGVLRKQLVAAGLKYELWTGGELRVAEHTLAWLREFGVPTLGSSRYVLIDYWGSQWPAHADPLIEHLLQENYRPILAHPERMDLQDDEWETVLCRLEHCDVRLQGNLKCLAGREGPRVAKRATHLLRGNRYRAVATDMHGTPDLADRLAGLIAVTEQVGATKLRALLADEPRSILNPQ
jgi:protein-tyrosine phosphatase